MAGIGYYGRRGVVSGIDKSLRVAYIWGIGMAPPISQCAIR